MAEKKITLSLVVPAYNEEKIIGENLKKIIRFLSGRKYGWEIIVADDGSKDGTSDIVKNFQNSNVRLIKLDKNKGKGAALRAGFLAARGEYALFSDADLSVPIESLDNFLEKLRENYVVIGSRRIKGAKILMHQPFIRENMGRVFTFLTKIVTGVNISDFTCGFKGFRNRAAKKIFAKSLINRWAYDAEIIFLARKFGFKVAQIPVSWTNRKDTRVVLGNVILESFRDLVRIRLNDFQGKYD